MGADTVFGIDRYVNNAQVIALVSAPGGIQAADQVTAGGPQRLNVSEVLRGIYLQPGFTIAGVRLRPGQTAVLLLPYARDSYQPSVGPRLWAIREDGTVDTGDIFPPNSLESLEKVTVETIRTAIERGTPEVAGLCRQVEAVNAFGYISGLFKAYPPPHLPTGNGIDSERLRIGLEAIAAWKRSNRQP